MKLSLNSPARGCPVPGRSRCLGGAAWGLLAFLLSLLTASDAQGAGPPDARPFAKAPVRALVNGSAGTITYMGGDFGVIPAYPDLAYVARKENGTWGPVCGGGVDGPVWAIAVSSDGKRVAIGGTFTSAGGVAGSRSIALCEGGVWKALDTGLSGTVSALLFQGSTLYAGGDFTASPNGQVLRRIASWNGSKWTEVGTGVDGQVLALAWYGNELVAGGAFQNAGNVSAPFLASWNATLWKGLQGAPDGIVRALAVDGASLWAGGDFTHMGPKETLRVAKWNGTVWDRIGKLNAPVHALAVGTLGLCAGGEFTQADGTSSTDRFAIWQGSAWTGAGNGSPGFFPNKIVRALAGCSGQGGAAGGDFTQLRTAGGDSDHEAFWSASAWRTF